jgi:hypothetical protein
LKRNGVKNEMPDALYEPGFAKAFADDPRNQLED